MGTRLETIRQLLDTCAKTDYGSKASVRTHNAAAKKVHEIVRDAISEGCASVSELAPLLNEPRDALWMAHAFLEVGNVSQEIQEQCLSIIEEAAKGSGLEAMGNQMWLREYYRRTRQM